jgi:hypothetical protein
MHVQQDEKTSQGIQVEPRGFRLVVACCVRGPEEIVIE